MNRRLRKKLHRGEFVLFGALVTFKMPGINADGDGAEFFDREMDALLAFMDDHMLGAGGGYSEDGSAQFFVTKYARSKVRWRKHTVSVSVTAADCDQLYTYLASRNALAIDILRTDAWN